MNMSYCRFQNTLEDLRDCAEHIGDRGLSDYELEAMKDLVELCRKIANVDLDEESNENS
jgi:hypothetical protein